MTLNKSLFYEDDANKKTFSTHQYKREQHGFKTQDLNFDNQGPILCSWYKFNVKKIHRSVRRTRAHWYIYEKSSGNKILTCIECCKMRAESRQSSQKFSACWIGSVVTTASSAKTFQVYTTSDHTSVSFLLAKTVHYLKFKLKFQLRITTTSDNQTPKEILRNMCITLTINLL